MTRRWVRTAGLLGTALLLGGCAGEDGTCALAPIRLVTSCASSVTVDGVNYDQWGDNLPAPRGKRIGPAVYPGGCGGDCSDADPDTPTVVWQLRGVDGDEVVVARALGGRRFVVFGRAGVDPKEYFRFTKDKEWVLRR